MKTLKLTIIAAAFFSFASCSDDTVVPSPVNTTPEEVEMSTLEKLAQEWVLDETFKNGQLLNENGTGEYLFGWDGGFFFNSRGSWEPFGNYEFENADSNSLSMLFTGTSTPVTMHIHTLTETELKTEFESGGSKFNYNYIR